MDHITNHMGHIIQDENMKLCVSGCTAVTLRKGHHECIPI